MTIYIDADYKCYTTSAEDRTSVVTDAFDGYCPEFIEGCRFVPAGEEWTREDGTIFIGEMKCPWKPSTELEKVQAAYEIEKLKAELAEADTALEVVYGTEN